MVAMTGNNACRRRAVIVLAAVAMLATAPAGADAQRIGPPMPTDEVLRRHNRPLPPPPAVPVPAAPSPSTSPGTVPRSAGRDPISRCQHEATVKRIPRSRRAAYIHQCMGN